MCRSGQALLSLGRRAAAKLTIGGGGGTGRLSMPLPVTRTCRSCAFGTLECSFDFMQRGTCNRTQLGSEHALRVRVRPGLSLREKLAPSLDQGLFCKFLKQTLSSPRLFGGPTISHTVTRRRPSKSNKSMLDSLKLVLSAHGKCSTKLHNHAKMPQVPYTNAPTSQLI